MAKGYKLIALRMFFLCSQGKSPFLEYAAALTEARNVAGPTVITNTIYKYQLLFHSHTALLLRIMALPTPDITVDDLISLMPMQWESIVTKGISRSSARSTSLISTVASRSPSVSPRSPPPLTDAERTHLTHVGRTFPGDAAQGVSPGCDIVEVKQEIADFALLNIDLFG
jgi:hypothetical protein